MLSQVVILQVTAVTVFLIALVLIASYIRLNHYKGEFDISIKKKTLTPDENSCEIGLSIYKPCNMKRKRDFCIEEAEDLFISDYFDKNKCTVFVGVPFLTKAGQSGLKIMIKALVSRCSFNVVLLNNSKHTFVYPWKYISAIQNAYNDAEQFAAAIRNAQRRGLMRPDCVVGVGYSLAANTLGHVCRMLEHPCQAIYAIDPAGLLFKPPGPNIPPFLQLVSHQDACHVVFLLCTHDILGTKYHLGHVNIILNDGQIQPSCEKGIFNKYIMGLDQYCSHSHCNKVFANAISSRGSCVARRCEILGGFISGCTLPGYKLDVAPDRTFYECGLKQAGVFSLETLPNATCKKL